MITLRRAETDAELAVYVERWNALTPGEASLEQQRERLRREPRRLHVLAELDGAPAGCGFAGPSDSAGRGFLQPRVLPAARRCGIGAAVLGVLGEHLHELGFATASSHVDGDDDGSLAFAARHGFTEVDRQVEQVKVVGDEPEATVPPGVELVSVAARPSLLGEAYPLARQGYADMATPEPVGIGLDEWLSDEATIPAGSLAALAGGDLVGYTGLCRAPDGAVEDGLTVVRRDWRRRGLALALKRAKLAWAATNGIEEIVTWTQRGNESMRAVNERLGYVYRSVSITVNAPLPLARH
jgi:mycothiol synthase